MEQQPAAPPHFIATLARISLFNHKKIFALFLLVSAAGLYSLLAYPVFSAGPATGLVFFLVAVIMPMMLSLMLRSFRKALTAVVPAVAAMLLMQLTIFFSGAALIENQAVMFFPVVLAIGSGINYILVNSYFSERRKPTTAANAVYLAYSQNGRPLLGMYTLLVVSFLSLSTLPETRLLGVMTALALSYSFLYTVLVLPALLNIYDTRRAAAALSPLESSVLKYLKMFDYTGPLASALGVASHDVNAAANSLKRKGLLGPYFFSFGDPLVWFMLIFSYLAGSTLALGTFSAAGVLTMNFASILLLTLGVSVMADGTLAGRIAGPVMILASLYSVYQSVPQGNFPLALLLALVGAGSAILASRGILVMVSNVLAGAFYSAVFAYGWLANGGAAVPPVAWLLAIAVVVFFVQLVLEEEVYVTV